MTTEDVFKFAYGYSLSIFKYMEKNIGKEKLIDLLKGASAENSETLMRSFTKGVPGNMKALSGHGEDMDVFTSLQQCFFLYDN